MSGTHEDEILKLRLLAAAHPNARIMSRLAEAYRRAGELDRARMAVEAGRDLDPLDPGTHLVLGRVLWDLGEEAGARRAFRRVLDLDPDNASAVEWLDRASHGNGRNGANGASEHDAAAHDALAHDALAHDALAHDALAHDAPAHDAPAHGAPAHGAPAHDAPAAVEIESPIPSDLPIPSFTTSGAEASATRSIQDYLKTMISFAPATPASVAPATEASADAAPASDTPAIDTSATAAPMIDAPTTTAPTGGAPASDDDSPGLAAAHADSGGRPTAGADHDAENADARAPAARDAEGIDLVALTDVLVGLLEYRDRYYRGGSSLTRLVATALGRELGLGGEDLERLALGAVLRDLGRLALGGRLIEATSPDLDEDARRRVQSHVGMGLRLLEGVRLPAAVRDAVRHHHERWDGGGYPSGLKGEEIPLVARIVAVADSLSAMISPRPYRPPRRLSAAIAEIRAEAGRMYDPRVVDALIRILPDRLRRRVLGFGLRQHVVIVDPDRARAVMLAIRFCSHGFLAEPAADPDEARERMRRFPADALLLSASLPDDGARRLLDAIRDDDATTGVPVAVLHADDLDHRVALLRRGADLCFPCGIAFDELRAGLGALLRRGAAHAEDDIEAGTTAAWHALRGELRDFPLSWLMQMLNYDGRSAAIVLRSGREQGTVYVDRGEVQHARVGRVTGEEALYLMLRWSEGSFVVRPGEHTAERTVERSLMHLLLDRAVADDHEATIFGAVQTE